MISKMFLVRTQLFKIFKLHVTVQDALSGVDKLSLVMRLERRTSKDSSSRLIIRPLVYRNGQYAVSRQSKYRTLE